MTAARQALEEALEAPGLERARGNLELQIIALANPCKAMIVRNITNLTTLDQKALPIVIARCYAVAGSLPNAAPINAFTNRFLDDIFRGG